MLRPLLPVVLLILSTALACAAQSSGSGSSPSQDSAAKPAPSQCASSSASQPPAKDADAKKTKKVWTNEEVSGLNGPVSVVGDPRDAKKSEKGSSAGAIANSSTIARHRSELQKLHAYLEQIDKRIADLKKFNSGETTGAPGLQLHRGYCTVPIPDQIKQLETRKQQTQARIDSLEDEARKKGLEPGQLRQ